MNNAFHLLLSALYLRVYVTSTTSPALLFSGLSFPFFHIFFSHIFPLTSLISITTAAPLSLIFFTLDYNFGSFVIPLLLIFHFYLFFFPYLRTQSLRACVRLHLYFIYIYLSFFPSSSILVSLIFSICTVLIHL